MNDKKTNPLRPLIPFVCRVAGYATIMVMLYLVLKHDASTVSSTGKFGENSVTEIVQEVFLFLLGIIFLCAGRIKPAVAPVTRLTAIFFFMAFIREFNNHISFWFYLVLPLLLLFVWLLIRDWRRVVTAALTLTEMPAMAWMINGFLVTFVFSRLFGKTSLWMAILEDNYHRWAKNAAEEGIELLGYSLLFIGGIEVLLCLLKHRKR